MGAGRCRVFTATTVGGDYFASAGLPNDHTARDQFGALVMSLLSKVDDPPLHLDLSELVSDPDGYEHYASVRFEFPGTWEIVEPNAPLRRLGGNIDPDAYALGDPKAMGYGRA